jgi:hypothetical protein
MVPANEAVAKLFVGLIGFLLLPIYRLKEMEIDIPLNFFKTTTFQRHRR